MVGDSDWSKVSFMAELTNLPIVLYVHMLQPYTNFFSPNSSLGHFDPMEMCSCDRPQCDLQ